MSKAEGRKESERVRVRDEESACVPVVDARGGGADGVVLERVAGQARDGERVGVDDAPVVRGVCGLAVMKPQEERAVVRRHRLVDEHAQRRVRVGGAGGARVGDLAGHG